GIPRGGELRVTQENKMIKLESNQLAQEPPVLHKLSVAYGKAQDLLLSDGSEVTVNAGSVMVFPDRFTGKTRSVFLNGEAFFKIKKDANKPFIVKTRHNNVEVLGTQFNLRSYDSDDKVYTSLVEGKVKVELGRPDRTQYLVPGEQLAYGKSSRQVELKHFRQEEILAWKNHTIVLKGKPFKQVIPELERFFDIEIECRSKEFLSTKIVGIFKQYKGNFETFIEDLKALKTAHSFIVEGRRVIIDCRQMI
ncbi:MAG: FecR domain-containing protein, partial [Cytophagales bacterium]|nr:FecR domain-containing protein [Cytophagales bacterium]